ncbi:unnamed protein product [Blepharisma stoltei]|uniref:Uncharacterized protein n=1 Tax=Blepharisma stoltei TaxID=1481888 RepID=A0AAU9IXA2_9CILI|nr:unnamed protein product [Blepharisma stoltei]
MNMKFSILICLLGVSTAWWCNGHMVTAMIAQLDLQANYPEVFEQANQILAPLNGVLTHGLSNSFVETACWADDLKTYKFEISNDWHYIDKPYNVDGLLNATAPTTNNIIWAISQAMSTLRQVNSTSSPLEASMQLRYLIHWLGDLHQPLHATQRFTVTQQSGDAGGNFFKIYYSENPQVNNLHKLWDWALGTIGDDCPRPLSSSCWTEITGYAKAIMDDYPRDKLASYLMYTSTSDWSLQSFRSAVDYVYSDIEQGKSPTTAYVLRGKPIAQRQLALGGYRLADLLKSLYANPNNS